ncbi:MAG: hypothetical protein NXY57DRAFT_206437 [Lentinula lateritia]|nr:MAG: hypothetical protein NXY57DRAFT_206437 [Lentinula lateritia]
MIFFLHDNHIASFSPKYYFKYEVDEGFDNLNGSGHTSIHQSFIHIIDDRLRTGYVPTSTEELSEVHLFLSDAESSLGDLGQEALDAEQMEGREILLRAMENARALLSPIRKFPPGILYMIFSSCIRNVPDRFKQIPIFYSLVLGDGKSLYCPTIRLSWVCSFWCKVALGLFFSLVFCFDFPPQYCSKASQTPIIKSLSKAIAENSPRLILSFAKVV